MVKSFNVGAVLILDGKESTVRHITEHPAGFFIQFNNRAGITVKRLESTERRTA